MIEKSIEIQAREYIYDLKNCASEFGQSTPEGWEFSLVSDTERKKIEKDYYPTVSAHPAQESLFELFRLVKSKLLQMPGHTDYGIEVNSASHNNMAYLIAFNPKFRR